MGKMISIWGKSGAGKSTLASNLACCLVKKGNLVGVMGTNTIYGSLQHFFGMTITEDKSLYNAIQTFNNEDEIIKNFVPHPVMKDLFILSMANTDDSLKIEKISNEMGKSILFNTRDAFDYFIIDCTDAKNDALTLISLSYADVVIEVMRPTIQGIAYHIANEKLIDGLKINDKIRLVLNCDRNFLNPKDITSKIKMNVAENLPYSINIERSENTGEPIYLSGKLIGADRKYIKAVQKIAESLEKKLGTESRNKLKFFKKG